jgi:hypothetical protein
MIGRTLLFLIATLGSTGRIQRAGRGARARSRPRRFGRHSAPFRRVSASVVERLPSRSSLGGHGNDHYGHDMTTFVANA